MLIGVSRVRIPPQGLTAVGSSAAEQPKKDRIQDFYLCDLKLGDSGAQEMVTSPLRKERTRFESWTLD